MMTLDPSPALAFADLALKGREVGASTPSQASSEPVSDSMVALWGFEGQLQAREAIRPGTLYGILTLSEGHL
jgi:hypothetical protein